MLKQYSALYVETFYIQCRTVDVRYFYNSCTLELRYLYGVYAVAHKSSDKSHFSLFSIRLIMSISIANRLRRQQELNGSNMVLPIHYTYMYTGIYLSIYWSTLQSSPVPLFFLIFFILVWAFTPIFLLANKKYAIFSKTNYVSQNCPNVIGL